MTKEEIELIEKGNEETVEQMSGMHCLPGDDGNQDCNVPEKVTLGFGRVFWLFTYMFKHNCADGNGGGNGKTLTLKLPGGASVTFPTSDLYRIAAVAGVVYLILAKHGIDPLTLLGVGQ